MLIATHGTGQPHLKQKELNRLIKLTNEAHRSRDHARRVDAYLALLVRTASQREGNVTVSPECVVAAVSPDGGGWHRAFDKEGHRCDSEMLPTVASGWPVDDVIKAMMPVMMQHMAAAREAQNDGRKPPAMDDEALNKATESINDNPDDSFPI